MSRIFQGYKRVCHESFSAKRGYRTCSLVRICSRPTQRERSARVRTRLCTHRSRAGWELQAHSPARKCNTKS